jgi:hypothetical protein
MKTYFAKSILVSKTFWVNVALIIAALAEQADFINVLPGNVGAAFIQIAAVVNIVLRIYSVRPVAMIAPSEIKPVDVPNAEGRPKPA